MTGMSPPSSCAAAGLPVPWFLPSACLAAWREPCSRRNGYAPVLAGMSRNEVAFQELVRVLEAAVRAAVIALEPDWRRRHLHDRHLHGRRSGSAQQRLTATVNPTSVDRQQQSHRVHQNIMLSAVDFLAAIVAMLAASFRCLDRLAVNAGSARRGAGHLPGVWVCGFGVVSRERSVGEPVTCPGRKEVF
jgi:hypothetical protein